MQKLLLLLLLLLLVLLLVVKLAVPVDCPLHQHCLRTFQNKLSADRHGWHAKD
jgi:hypothetical protein